MTLYKKLQDSMRQGVILERDRCMRVLFELAKHTKKGLDKKLMTATEKHLAEVRFKIAEGIIAAAQMKIMSGEDPDAKEAPSQIHGPDGNALGQEQGDPDGAG